VDLSLAKRVLVARRLTFVANRLGLIAWLAWLVRNEEDRHKESATAKTQMNIGDTPVKSGAPA
jgi:hypothetical protein